MKTFKIKYSIIGDGKTQHRAIKIESETPEQAIIDFCKIHNVEYDGNGLPFMWQDGDLFYTIGSIKEYINNKPSSLELVEIYKEKSNNIAKEFSEVQEFYLKLNKSDETLENRVKICGCKSMLHNLNNFQNHCRRQIRKFEKQSVTRK